MWRCGDHGGDVVGIESRENERTRVVTRVRNVVRARLGFCILYFCFFFFFVLVSWDVLVLFLGGIAWCFFFFGLVWYF